MKAMADGLGTTTERLASPLNFNRASDSYCNMYTEDRLFGATPDAYSHKRQDHFKLTQNVKQRHGEGPKMGNI